MYIDTTIEHDTTRRLKVAIESYAEDRPESPQRCRDRSLEFCDFYSSSAMDSYIKLQISLMYVYN